MANPRYTEEAYLLQDPTHLSAPKTESKHLEYSDVRLTPVLAQQKSNWGVYLKLFKQSCGLVVLGLIFVIPIYVGDTIGGWLDQDILDYSFLYRICFILAGVFIGAYAVFWLFWKYEH